MFRVVDRSLPQAPMTGGCTAGPLGEGRVAECGPVRSRGLSPAVLRGSEPRSSEHLRRNSPDQPSK